MQAIAHWLQAALPAGCAKLTPPAAAQPNYPTPREGQGIAPDARARTGEVLPELRLACTTVG